MSPMSERKVAVIGAHFDAHVPDADDECLQRVSWAKQREVLLHEVQCFRCYAQMDFEPHLGDEVDYALIKRTCDGDWPQLKPAVARLLYERLVNALAVVVANDAARPISGVPMPAAIKGDALTGALLLYWCFEMRLLLSPAQDDDIPKRARG